MTPQKGHFIKLFIEDNNCQFHHGGTSRTLAQQRTKMWTPQSHTEVKSALRQYFIFIKDQGPYKAKSIVQKHWLKSKVIKSKASFYTGLDYFKLLYVKRGKDQIKTWICLFARIAIRTIYLEQAEDMTLEQLLQSLRWFIPRRSKPDQIVLDNGPNFKVV